MTKFFTDIMLDAGAIYTLWGSKPITTIPLYLYSEEEEKAYDDQLSDEEKQKLIYVVYDLPDNWEKWEKIRSRFPINGYLFFIKQNPIDPKVPFIFFVNIFNTAVLLFEHYDCFSRETGLDFDPLQVVFEINQDSEFWNKVLQNSRLTGLLYGFGITNSCGFKWKHGDYSKYDKFASSLEFHFSDSPAFGKATIEKFPLPIFASFSWKSDEMIEKYRREREEIKAVYRGKDFLDLTLSRLTH